MGACTEDWGEGLDFILDEVDLSVFSPGVSPADMRPSSFASTPPEGDAVFGNSPSEIESPTESTAASEASDFL